VAVLKQRPAHAVLLLSCPDQRGIVAAVADFIAGHQGNIVHAEQHTDTLERMFFQRVEFELDGFDLDRDEVLPALAPMVERLALRAELRFMDVPMRTAILASRQAHCLYDLLTRWTTGELPADVTTVVSNHPDHAEYVGHLGVEFVHLPVEQGHKDAQERELIATLQDRRTDLVVLARYMQILGPSVVAAFAGRTINIHHSFLPAFVGANPYRQASERGVKLIGATAHYVTDDLDEGPIIEQETVRVTHRDDVAELTSKGRDLETIVLARAVRAHLDHRVLVHGRRTVVFD
jgi:formyltetrahydrofolate deformylase